MNCARLIFILTLAALGQQAVGQTPVASVPSVDLSRYVGKWFEIASFPMFFQRHCIADTMAEYSSASDGAINVHNRCRTESGFDDANGKARVVEGSGNGRLKVWFFWPFKADYWIIGLDDKYRWAVVGNPNRKYLWILSRTPQLPDDQLQAALAAAAAQGYDLKMLRYTAQSGAGQAPR